MKDAPFSFMRGPDQVMRLARMGAMFPTRLSFLRVILRQLAQDGAEVTRPVWDINSEGFGHAVYQLELGGHDYALIAVSTPLPADMRSDRVIATAWDTAYVLYDGVPSEAEIARIARDAPRQEAARFTERDLVLSRANRSVRLFDHVVTRLRAGAQPDASLLHKVGYLMRTTAVYGNGKFGIADRHLIAGRPGLEGPFAAEMLTIWLIRSFTLDLVEHLGGATLEPRLKRSLGIGNATGLGMAPFLVSHPRLLNNWMEMRETALARVLAQGCLPEADLPRLQDLAARAARHIDGWQVADCTATERLAQLRREWPEVQGWLTGQVDLQELMTRAEDLSLDTQELLVALLLETAGPLIDDLARGMADAGGAALTLPDCDALRQLLDQHYGWALAIDLEDPSQTARFWYVSEEKMEPRLGQRRKEPGAELESPLDVVRRMQDLRLALDRFGDLRALLAAEPEHHWAIERAQIAATHGYSEIRDNLIAASCLPIDMLRCKLSFFGATRFDPKSDLWTRVTLAQGAPLAHELGLAGADDWWLPEPVS